MPYFKYDQKCVKYMVLSTFLFTDGLKVLIANQSLLDFFNHFSTPRSQFKLQFIQAPKTLSWDA